MQKYINKLNKIIENKALLAFSYGFLLLLQYIIIENITWRLDSIYFVSLTFSLLLLFIIFSTFFISFFVSIILIILVAYNKWQYILFWLFVGILIAFIILIIYKVVNSYFKKHTEIFDKIYSIWFKIYIKLLIVFWLLVFITTYFLLWKSLLFEPKSIIVEKENWKYDEYKLRFYNIDYYFLETSSWTIKIYDASTIKSIEFKK